MQTQINVKWLLRTSLMAIGFTFLLQIVLSAQPADTPPPAFVSVACFKAKTPDFDKITQEMWVPFMTHMQKKGKILDWMMYKVVSPNGQDCECDYREIVVHPDINSLKMFLFDEGMMEEAVLAFPDKDLMALGKRFEEAIEFRGSQTYRMIDASSQGRPENLDIIVLNHMTVPPGMGEAYVKMEQEVFKPVHVAHVAAGGRVGWMLQERIMPHGSDFDGNYITIDVYRTLEQLFAPPAADLWNKVHPNTKPEEAFQKIMKLRDLKRSEVLKLAYDLE